MGRFSLSDDHTTTSSPSSDDDELGTTTAEDLQELQQQQLQSFSSLSSVVTPPVATAAPHATAIHIYYHNGDSSKEQRQGRKLWCWCWRWTVAAAIIVLLAHIVTRYGPPGPPPLSSSVDDDELKSWNEFLMDETSQFLTSLSRLTSIIPHVWHWCVQNIRRDLNEVLYDQWITRPQPCRPFVMGRSNGDWHNNNNNNNDTIDVVGQSRAVTIVREALSAWEEEADHDQKQQQSSSSSSLFLLLTGTVGVGKSTLAMQVAKYVYGDCVDSGAALVVLNGRDAITTSSSNDWDDVGGLLATTIRQKLQRQGRYGLVVILQHAETLSSRQFVQICRILQSTSQQHRVVLMAITNVGTKTIHQYMKHQHQRQHHGSIEQISQIELDTAVREEIDDYFHEDIAEYFHAIVPFVPIGQSQLQDILKLKIEKLSQERRGVEWTSLSMTDELAAALVDPSHVEYIEWRDRTSGETVLIFSAAGAHVLETGSPIMNKVMSQVKRCFSSTTEESVGILDYDKGTRQGVVRWCEEGDSSLCEECCRFSID